MAETVTQNTETTEATETKKEGIFVRAWNFVKSHAKGFLSVGAGVGAGFLLACLAGGGKDDSEPADEYYEYSDNGEVEEGGSEE